MLIVHEKVFIPTPRLSNHPRLTRKQELRTPLCMMNRKKKAAKIIIKNPRIT